MHAYSALQNVVTLVTPLSSGAVDVHTLPVCTWPDEHEQLWYCVMESPLEQDEATTGVHEADWYEPLRVPLLHTRVCQAQVCPADTDELWYAATLAPSATVCPLNVQEAAATTVAVQVACDALASVTVPVKVVGAVTGPYVHEPEATGDINIEPGAG